MERNYYTEKENAAKLTAQNPIPEMNEPQGDIFDRKNQRATDIQAERKANEEKYGVQLRDDQYEVLNNFLKTADGYDDLEKISNRMACAMVYADKLGKPLEDTFVNLEAYNKATLGQESPNVDDKGNLRAITDNFQMGVNTLKMGALGFQAMLFANAGNEDEVNFNVEKYRLLQQDNEVMADPVKRHWTVEAVKFGAMTAPFTGAAIGAALIPAVGPALSFGVSFENSVGLEYMELRDQGASHEVARNVATVSGGLQAVVEVALGDVAAATGGVLKNIVGKAIGEEVRNRIINTATQNLFKTLHHSGTLQKYAKILVRYGMENLEEGAEEVVQDLISIAGKSIAASIEGYDIEGDSFEEIVKSAAENFKGGFMGSLVLGIPIQGSVHLINKTATTAEIKNVRNMADSMQSEAMFMKAAKDSPIWGNVSDAEKYEAMHNIYLNAQNTRDEQFTKAAQEISELTQPAEGFEETVKDENGDIVNEAAYRENGTLYTQDDVRESSDGETKGTYKLGNPTTRGKNLYGYIDYTINENDHTVTVDKFIMSDAREDLRGEFFDKFAKDNAGYEIQWNPTEQRAIDLKESLVKANPSGKNNGLSYYTDADTVADIQTRKNIASQIKKAMPKLSNTQIAADVALLETVYKSLKNDNGYTSFTDYVNKTFSDQIFGDTATLNQSALNDNKVVRGGVSFKETEKGLRAVIYAGENADFSTWNHEVAHVFRQQLQGDLLNKAEEAFGVQNGNWTKDNEEAFAIGFEQFLRTGKAKNSAVKELFTKLAEFMARVYGALKGHIKFNPEVEAVYNELLKGGEGSELALAEKAVRESDKAIRAEEKAYQEEQKSNQAKIKEQENFENKESSYIEEEQIQEKETTETTENFTEKDIVDEEGNLDFKKVMSVAEQIQAQIDEETLRNTEKQKQTILDSLSNLDPNVAEDIAERAINGTMTEKDQATLEAAGLNRDGTIDLYQLISDETVEYIANEKLVNLLKENLVLANEYQKKGYTPATIKRVTGWQNVNGKWLFETDDSNSVLLNTNELKSLKELSTQVLKEMPFRLSHFLKHDKAYAMFPELKNKRVVFVNDNTSRIGSMYVDNAIVVNLTAEDVNKSFQAAIQRYIQSLTNDIDYGPTADLYDEYVKVFEAAGLEKVSGIKQFISTKGINEATKAYLENELNQEVLNTANRLKMSNDARHYNLLEKTNSTDQMFYQAQKDDVREMYEGTDKWLKAPNGQDTNLTEDQWLTVRTPNFKNWFGDWEKDPQNASKVTDNNGEPRVVFHGTYNGDFDVFDRSKASTESDMGAGFYFTSNEDDVERNYEGGGPDFENKVERLAERIADEEEIDYDEAKEKAREQLYVDSNLYDVFLDMKYPCYTNETDIVEGLNENLGLNMDDFENEDDYYDELYAAQEDTLVEIKDAITSTGWYGAEEAADKVMEFFSNGNGTLQDLKDFINDGTIEVEDDNGNYANNEIARIVADTLGYDGIIDSSVSDKFKNMNLDEDTTHFIMFNNTSIKSATDNNGEFSRENPSILYQTVDLTNELIDVNNKVITAQTIENHLNKLIGQVFDTATSPLKIKITKNNKPHIISTNVKLKGAQEKRHNAALSIIEKIINNATMTGKPEDVDLSHNTNKKTLAHKQNVLKYITFVTPARFNTDLYDIELTTERVKGQTPSLLDLYNVKVKSKGPIATNLIALQQGPTALNNTTNDSNVNTELDLFQNGNTSYDNTMDSPQFKAWFGDWKNDPENSSKVVDENGKPLIMYHGTMEDFTVFDSSKWGDKTGKDKGFFFSEYKDEAEDYAKDIENNITGIVKEVYLNVRNPLIIDSAWAERNEDHVKPMVTFTNTEYFDTYKEKYIYPEFEKGNYDGIIIDNGHGKTVIVFTANQIKSTTDNNGQFDPNNPSMLFQPAYHGSAANFDKFNTDEYGFSGEGSMSFGYGTYVSASEDIARDYAERQRPDKEETITYKGIKVEPGYLKALWIHLNQYDFNIQDTAAWIREDIEWAKSKPSYPNDFYLEYVAEREAELELIESEDFNINDFNTDKPLTNLYTVEIPDTGFIKWDEDADPKLAKTVKDAVFNKLTTEPNEDGDFEYKGVEKELQRELNDVFDNEMTGQQLYNNVAIYVGGERNASKLLNKLGIPGIDYPAGTNFGTPDGKEARNFVIFNDDDAKIVDHMLFQTMDELYKDARDFDNWQEFMEYYESFGKPEVSLVPEDADAEWYQTTWELARNIKPESQENEDMIQAQVKEDQTADDAPEAKDAMFVTKLNRPGELEKFLVRVNDIMNMDLDMFTDVQNEMEAQERQDLMDIQDYIRTQLRHGSWLSNAGRAANNKPLTNKARQTLLTLISNSARDYRDIYSTIMEDDQFSVANKDKVANKLEKFRLADPEVDYERLAPEERRRIADKLENEEIARKIKDGSMPMNEELDKYIKYLDDQIKAAEKETRDAEKNLKELGMEVQGDYQRIADWETRRLLELHDELLMAKTKLTNHSNDMARRLNRGIAITGKYEKASQNLKANYDTIFRKFDDLRKSIEINEQIKAALKQREQVAEIKDKIKDKETEKKLVEKAKKMRINLVKRAMRRVPFTRINYDQARTLIAIQRVLEPNLLGGVNKWIGQDQAYLRGVISEWITDEEARTKLEKYLTTKGTKTALDVLAKLKDTKTVEDFNAWTKQERQKAHRALPKENWIRELNLDKLAEEREQSIQLDIDTKTETKEVTGPDGKKTYLTRTNITMNPELEQEIKEVLGAKLFIQVMEVPFNEWTTEQMEDLAKRVDEIYIEGRNLLAAKNLARKEFADDIRKRIEDAIKTTGIKIEDGDDEETKRRKREKIEKILGKNKELKGVLEGSDKGFFKSIKRIVNGYGDANVLRVTRILDNYSEGVNVEELYRKEDYCFNAKERSIQERNRAVEKIMAENNITAEELMESVKVLDHEFTVDELLYFKAANMDYEEDTSKIIADNDYYRLSLNDDYAPTSRNAVMFGNMLSSNADIEFKEQCRNEDEAMQKRIEANDLTADERNAKALGLLVTKPGTKKYLEACKTMYANVLAAADRLDSKYAVLLDTINQDYADQYDRMNKTSIEVFNIPVGRVNNYVPLIRLESNGDTNENRVKEDLLGAYGIGKQWVDKGMTQKRISISPLNQKPVETGLYKTWTDSVNRTEHFIAYSDYVRELNRVYKSRDAQYLRSYIEGRYGKDMLHYIDEYINEVANPNYVGVKSDLDKIVRTLRGRTAPAYLAWKASGVIKQAATSPWPYMQFVSPDKYLAASFDILKSRGKLYDDIKSLSTFMNSRVFDPMVDVVNELAEKKTNPVNHALDQFSKLGMQGLEWIDWTCVAPGWLACYRDKYAELNNNNNAIYEMTKAQLTEENDARDIISPDRLTNAQIEAQAIAKQLSEADIQRLAVEYADDCTRKCQPSNRAVDLAPLFKAKGPNSEVGKALLQFQTSLNVIWQNIRYDLPYAVRNKEYNQIVGMILGYVFAGILMNAITDTPDEDDDEEMKLKKFIWYSTTQFTDAIPVLGQTVSNLNYQMITGKKNYSSPNDIMPMISKFVKAAESGRAGNWDKAAKNFAEGVGMGAGLPVSGAKELLWAAGIGDGDGELEPRPDAFIGRRSKDD